MNTVRLEYPADLEEYTLLDSGEGEKLEVFHGYTIARPDPRAIWNKSKPASLWENAHAHYRRTDAESGTWTVTTPPPNPWTLRYRNLMFLLKPTDFKHVGLFPEQAVNWDWMGTRIGTRNISVLNLFAYTGAATAVCSALGATVTHVDSVKSTIDWAHANYHNNRIPQNRVRWIQDDALKFVTREAKRGNTYDAIIMDPPRFGRGPKGEIWKIEQDLPRLVDACRQILSPTPLFVVMNAYTADLSSLVLGHLMEDLVGNRPGTIELSELTTRERDSGRLLPQGIVSRWSAQG